jgi:hypothetical protein
VAVDKRVAKRRLEEMLNTVFWHRNDLEVYRSKGDAPGVERCKQILKLDYLHIREHCAEYGLELPHDVPSEGAK